MKLQTLLTVPNRAITDIKYVKEVKVLEKSLKKKYIEYPIQDLLIFWDWLYINRIFLAY